MFEYDYCFCGNYEKCPKKDECRRAISVPGIHTYSAFYVEGEECKEFWQKQEKKNG